MAAHLPYLPTELYVAIVGHLETISDDIEFKQSLLALSRAIPGSPLPLDRLFRKIIITKPCQTLPLHLRLRKDPRVAGLVEVFKYECWEGDANVIVNLVGQVMNVTELTLFIGTNFAPDHLDELFKKPRSTLKSLSVRFRPYVMKASYYQFHSASYFDSAFAYMSQWPRASLPKLSIIQDPVDDKFVPRGFAQPMVFFSFEPVSQLAASLFACTITSVRLRVPARQITAHLHKYENSWPAVRLLDISTCRVSELDIENLLVDQENLEMLVMDGCPIVTQRADALEAAGAEALSQWQSLGKALALVGVKRTKQQERNMKRLLEREEALAIALPATALPPPQSKKPKKGRKGLATATVSLRASPPNQTASLPRIVPPPRTGQIVVTAPASSGQQKKKSPLLEFRISPSDPNIRSIAMTAPMASVQHPDFTERYATVRAAFETGWDDGLRILELQRTRMRATWRTQAVRVFLAEGQYRKIYGDAPSPPESPIPGSSTLVDMVEESMNKLKLSQELYAGVRDVRDADDFDIKGVKRPILCLAGPEKNDFHPDGCPHHENWRIWDDGL